MKVTASYLTRLLLAMLAPLAAQCTSMKGTKPAAERGGAEVKAEAAEKPAAGGAEAAGVEDDLDEYAVVEIGDPLEGLNRATFWCNDKMYLILCKPVSKGYEKLVPKPVRKGIFNAFENAKYPVRLLNSALTGEFKRVGLHTEKFLLNTIAGLGGMIRVADKFPELAELPEEDMGKTFAKWGMGHGAYLVIPFLGPSSVRDGVGLIGDYAANPVNWGVYWYGQYDWTAIPPSVNTLRALPAQLSVYEETKRDAIDPYIAVRSAYVQFRSEAVKK